MKILKLSIIFLSLFSSPLFALPNGCEQYYSQGHDIFILRESAGNHNSNFLIFKASYDDESLSTRTFKVPSFDTEKKTIQTTHLIFGHIKFFDPEKKKLIVNVHAGDVSGFEGIQKIYKIEDEELILIIQRHTKKYKALWSSEDNFITPALASKDKNWINDYIIP